MTSPHSWTGWSRFSPLLAATVAGLVLAACGGGSTAAYTMAGSVAGLSGTGLILANKQDSLSVAANSVSFAFPGAQTAASYNVHLLAQPAGQTCSVSNGSGSGGSAVSNVLVQCRAYWAYVADAAGNAIAQFSQAADGTLSPAQPASVSTNGAVSALAVSSDGQHAWANYQDSKAVSALGIGSNGTLALQVSSALAGSSSSMGQSLALSPDDSTLYAANYASATVSAFSLDASGAATALGSPVASGVNPFSLVVTPDGTHLYVSNQSGDSVSGYRIDSGGGLSALNPATTSTSSQGSSPAGMVVTPSGGTLLVALGASAKLVAYNINSATGALTLHTSVSTGLSPRGVAITPSGAFVYVANYGASTVSGYSLAGGGLTPLSTPTTAVGSHPSAISISPDGRYAYVTNTGDNSVSQFSIGASGVLSPLSPATLSSGGLSPLGMVVR